MSAATLPEWDLTDLYPGFESPAFKAALTQAAKDAAQFAEDYQGKMAGMDASAMAQMFERYEALSDLIGRIISYAGLAFASDMSDADTARHYGNTQSAVTDITGTLVFFDLELNDLEESHLEGLYAKDAGLARFKPVIDDARTMKPYQLSADLEKLLHDKDISGRAAFNRLFDETMASMQFTYRGQQKGVEEMLDLLTDADEAVRADAAAGLSAGFKDELRTFVLITNTLAKDKSIEDKWRKLPRPDSSRHIANQVEAEVVDALYNAVRDAYPRLSHRYYALKAKWMGKDQLNFWDRNAPLPGDDDRRFSWDEARDRVLAAYGRFSPDMAEVGKQFFEKPWIDAAIRPGKSPGAFSHGTVPSAHPYILVNYQGKTNDVMTLAHELGHGVHQCLAREQGALMADAPLTLAETASVFGEMLTFRSLLDETTDPSARKHLIAGKVEDMLNTVVRQIAFYDFEKRLHDARREGELTADEIGKIWMQVGAESLGPAIKLNEGYENWWTYIPHFIHSPFYVYAYAFGDCLVNSLYAVYEQADEGFAEKYLELLKAGGSKRHGELLAPFGLDAADPAFWQKGLSVIESYITQLEELD